MFIELTLESNRQTVAVARASREQIRQHPGTLASMIKLQSGDMLIVVQSLNEIRELCKSGDDQ